MKKSTEFAFIFFDEREGLINDRFSKNLYILALFWWAKRYGFSLPFRGPLSGDAAYL